MSPVIRTIWTQQSEDQASDSHENGDDGEVSALKLIISCQERVDFHFLFMKRWDDAVEVLDAIIEEDEANSSARKRKIAIFKAQGDRARTVAELNKYLKVFMSDQVNNRAGNFG